jgi:predicted ATPase
LKVIADCRVQNKEKDAMANQTSPSSLRNPQSAICNSIVLTGGPGAGKTVITKELAIRFREKLARVPEAATQVYDALGTRWDKLDYAGRCDAQRRMYHLQIQQESQLRSENPNRTLLLDRGTIDGATYWPDGSDAFWTDLNTSLERELSRYDVVIWLQTGAALGLYDGDASNPVRFEAADAAVEAGQRLLHLWGRHTNLAQVPAYEKFEDKIVAVSELVQHMLRS